MAPAPAENISSTTRLISKGVPSNQIGSQRNRDGRHQAPCVQLLAYAVRPSTVASRALIFRRAVGGLPESPSTRWLPIKDERRRWEGPDTRC